METSAQSTVQTASRNGESSPVGIDAAESVAGAALVKSPAPLLADSNVHNFGSAISRVPVEIDVSVPIRRFRVRNLLALARGSIIESQWHQGHDMPLAARGAQLAWAEFEVIDQRLGVRITRLV
jgi:flagellar motor switch/type III secretory pathway protein FliN